MFWRSLDSITLIQGNLGKWYIINYLETHNKSGLGIQWQLAMMVDVVDVDVVRGVSSAGCRHVSADAALDSAALSTCCDTVADTDEGAFCPVRAPTVCSQVLVALQIRMNISEIYSMFTAVEIVFFVLTIPSRIFDSIL